MSRDRHRLPDGTPKAPHARHAAEKRAVDVNERDGRVGRDRIVAYRCYCGWWHVGRKSAKPRHVWLTTKDRMARQDAILIEVGERVLAHLDDDSLGAIRKRFASAARVRAREIDRERLIG